MARHWTHGQIRRYDKAAFCFGHTSFLTPHRKQKRNTDKGFSNFAFWGRKKWMEIPEETNHPTTVTMATDSGSNALHRSSARADMGRQGKGWARLAGLVHSTNFRHSGRTWTFVEFVRLLSNWGYQGWHQTFNPPTSVSWVLDFQVWIPMPRLTPLECYGILMQRFPICPSIKPYVFWGEEAKQVIVTFSDHMLCIPQNWITEELWVTRNASLNNSRQRGKKSQIQVMFLKIKTI